jgi:anti-anti-sigma regulatory factor
VPGDRLAVLAGEIDAANDALLEAVLAEAARRADSELIVDCTELRFIRVSG